MVRDPCNIFCNIFVIVSNTKLWGAKKLRILDNITLHSLKPGHPDSESQPDGRPDSNILKHSQSNVC